MALEGIVGVHAYADSDRTAQSLDALELAKRYRDRGVRAMVLMNHFESTAGLAYPLIR